MIDRGIARLAEAMGEDPSELEKWVGAGLVTIKGDDEITASAAEEVRLVQLLRLRGFRPEDVAHLEITQPGLFGRYAQLVSGETKALIGLDDAIAATGLDPGFVERVWRATGFSDQGSVGDEEDVAAWQALAVALASGIPDDALVQLVRVYADSMARIAEAESKLFHFHVHERLRAEGLSSGEIADRTGEAIDQLLPLIEPTVTYFHRKAFARAVREDLMVHVAEDADLLQTGSETTGRLTLAVAFIDLARFTSMTQAMGDLVAADVLDRSSDLVRRAVLSAGGRLVKQIGDEFMLVFHGADHALAATAAIRSAAGAEPAFLATRIGVHFGSVLCREGDYIGATVNIAARVTAQAAPHQLLVTDAVRTALQNPGATFDPVCGMHVDVGTPDGAPRITEAGTTWAGEGVARDSVGKPLYRTRERRWAHARRPRPRSADRRIRARSES